MDNGLELLRSNPCMAPVYEPPLRRLIIKRRKVGIFYTVEGDRIFLHILADLRDSPAYIARRIREVLRK